MYPWSFKPLDTRVSTLSNFKLLLLLLLLFHCFSSVEKLMHTHQQNQEISVVFARLEVLNKSRTSPSLVSAFAPVSISSPFSGSSLRLTRAIFLYSFSASFIFPFTSSQRRDSGVRLQGTRVFLVIQLRLTKV